MAKANKQDIKNTSFEESLNRLEEIVNALENKDILLEDLVSSYKEGSTLAQHCLELIENAKSEIVAIQDKKTKID